MNKINNFNSPIYALFKNFVLCCKRKNPSCFIEEIKAYHLNNTLILLVLIKIY